MLRASVRRVQPAATPADDVAAARLNHRTRWCVVRLMLRAGVGRVQLMPLPRSDVCGAVCVRHDV